MELGNKRLHPAFLLITDGTLDSRGSLPWLTIPAPGILLRVKISPQNTPPLPLRDRETIYWEEAGGVLWVTAGEILP